MATTTSDQSTPPAEKVMVPFKFQPKQPKTLIPQSNIISFHDLTTQEEKDRLAKRGIKLLHSFEAPATENGRIFPAKALMPENKETYTLTVNIKYNKEETRSIVGTLYSNTIEGYRYSEWLDETPNMLTFAVPEGSYDVEVIVNTLHGDFILLTASEINVSGDSEITLDAADATVEIIWDALLPDGSVPSTGITIFDPETDDVIDKITGNVLITYNYCNLYNTKHNIGSMFSFNPYTWLIGDIKIEGGKGTVKTIPNKDYIFNYLNVAINNNGGYLIPLNATTSQSVTVSNDIVNFLTLTPQYATTPYQPEPQKYGEGKDEFIFEFEKSKTFNLSFAHILNCKLLGSGSMGVFTNGDKFSQSIHICQEPAELDEYNVMPIPSLIEDWDIDYGTLGLPIDMNHKSPIVLAINNTPVSPFLKLPEERYTYVSSSTNPWLSFDTDKPHVWNYGCPALVFSTLANGWGTTFDVSYIGRLGENRKIDLLSTETFVAVNNMPPTDEVLEYMQWGELPKEGKIDFELNDTNIAIDGIKGKNIARVGFDMSLSDWQPPTLQIVRFVDTEDNFVDRYSTGEEGFIEFYGGDFKSNYNPESYASWYTEEPAAEVKVEYAPYGTESFLPLEVENIPERDFMPGFGTYYRGSLASVDRKSENGWFDVRITLTDAAGNYQEQTLSPAFRIEDCVGIDTMTYPEIDVAVSNGNISVTGCESPLVEVYSAAGMMLNRMNGNQMNISGLGHGIYLVKVTDGTKKVIRKVSM